ncbi:hypothetical protein [Marinobacterium halophilum]|nr:hypothetical protein [Marinobacterium halophilum]
MASVKTRARFNIEYNQWVITGQKVWTSPAHEADLACITRGLTSIVYPFI